ncbi:hypothetical protein JHK85_019447 [Glycine max]|nr:hypothetical protein JHK85_019447 [Glycine max]
MPPITFMSNDFKAINPVQDDPMVISVEIANNTVKKTFVDQGSLTDILFWNIFKKMDIPESKILPHDDPLFSFAGEQRRHPLSSLDLKKNKSLNWETNSPMTTVVEYNGLFRSTLTYLNGMR